MTVYVCGITPYDSGHLGHAFTYVHFDVLVRYLRHLGAQVVHAQNVTDVDDDILRTARERGVDPQRLAARENAAFEKSMRSLRVATPSATPWASQFVPDMLADVEGLLAAGHGYERGGTVYFRVASDPDYGRLSGLSRAEMIALAGERGGRPDDPEKDDPLDFVLWQRSKPGEPWWESRCGPGRPGWHIECSTMARRILGQPVDIHGGGSDLIFPHHESELAQAEGLPGGGPFVRHWVHTGTVSLAGEKMSKSVGNLVFLDDLFEHHDPLAIRSLLLRRHYRKDWDFNEQELEPPWVSDPSPEVGGGNDDAEQLRSGFFAALDDDLDTPRAMAILDRAARAADPRASQLLEEAREVLGLSP